MVKEVSEMSECSGNEKTCQCMDCSYNRAEDSYYRSIEFSEYYDDDGWY